MLGKIFDVLISIAINGFFAIFVAALIYVVLCVVIAIAMIPVIIIAGNEAKDFIMNLVAHPRAFSLVYAIVFLSLLANDLSIPSIKTLYKNWQKKPV